VAGGIRASVMLGNGSKGKKGKGVLDWGFRREFILVYVLLFIMVVNGAGKE
jgi:hypothetical protein